MRGIDGADSLAFDLHKWFPGPFATGVLLVADAASHRATFATDASYLSPSKALAGSPDWAVNYGVALSRPFQGLAPYVIMRSRGIAALGEAIAYCVVLAHYFAHLIEASTSLRLAAPAVGNVILFQALDALGEAIDADVIANDLQERGETVFSTTRQNQTRVLRACFVNHLTRPAHVEQAIRELEGAVLRAGRSNSSSSEDALGDEFRSTDRGQPASRE